MPLVVKKGKPQFPKPSKDLAAKAARYDGLNLAWALKTRGSSTPQPFEPEHALLSRELADEAYSRILELAAHYKINDDGAGLYLMLIVALANDLVPNFNVYNPARGAGRPRKRHETYGPWLAMRVEAKAFQRGKGIADACLQLTKKGEEWAGHKASTLQARYYEVKRAFANMPPREQDPSARPIGLLSDFWIDMQRTTKIPE